MIRINAPSAFIIQQILRELYVRTLPIFAAEGLLAFDPNSLRFEDTDGCYSNDWSGYNFVIGS